MEPQRHTSVMNLGVCCAYSITNIAYHGVVWVISTSFSVTKRSREVPFALTVRCKILETQLITTALRTWVSMALHLLGVTIG